jgi:hypothetical protein
VLGRVEVVEGVLTEGCFVGTDVVEAWKEDRILSVVGFRMFGNIDCP